MTTKQRITYFLVAVGVIAPTGIGLGLLAAKIAVLLGWWPL